MKVEFLFRIGRNMRVLDANGVAKDVDVEALDRAAHAGNGDVVWQTHTHLDRCRYSFILWIVRIAVKHQLHRGPCPATESSKTPSTLNSRASTMPWRAPSESSCSTCSARERNPLKRSPSMWRRRSRTRARISACFARRASWRRGVMGRTCITALRTMMSFAYSCLLYTSDAADERSSVDLG